MISRLQARIRGIKIRKIFKEVDELSSRLNATKTKAKIILYDFIILQKNNISSNQTIKKQICYLGDEHAFYYGELRPVSDDESYEM